MPRARPDGGPPGPGAVLTGVTADPWEAQRRALGGFIRSQRRLAQLSLRQLATLSNISNPYLSQLERGLHVPSVRVLQSIAEALDLSAETLFAQAGLVREQADGGARSGATATEAAIRADTRLAEHQKEALIAVYRSYVERP